MSNKETLSSSSVANILQGTNNVQNNPNTLPTNADKQLEIYDKDGVLIGYIPVFNASWTGGFG